MAWHTDLNRRISIAGSRMRPDMPQPIYGEGGKTWRNLYRPPNHPSSGGDIVPFTEMIDWMFPEPVENAWFLNWTGHKLRRPAIRMTAVVMIAITKAQEQSFGSGRGTLFKILGKLLGDDYVRPASYAELTGKGSQAVYNDYLEGLLVTIDEAATDADDLKYHERRAAYEHSKAVIDTSPTKVRVKTKYGRTADTITYASFMIASNHANPMAIPPGDRRFTMLRNGPPLPRELAELLDTWMADPANIGAVYRWLGERDLSQFKPYEPLETAAKTRAMRRGISALDYLLAEARDVMLGRVFILAQLEAWLNSHGADDRELAGETVWAAQVKAAIGQHCRRLIRKDGRTPHRVRLRQGKRPTIYCWAEDEDEMTALANQSRQAVIDELIKNNPTDAAMVQGLTGNAFVEPRDDEADDGPGEGPGSGARAGAKVLPIAKAKARRKSM